MRDRTLRVMYQVLLLLTQYALYGHQMKRRFAKAMSDKNIFEKAKDMIGNVTKFQKQSKLKAGYLECDEFKDSNYDKIHDTRTATTTSTTTTATTTDT
jgi:hypothetical protein